MQPQYVVKSDFLQSLWHLLQVLDCETECYSEIITHTAVKRCNKGCGCNGPEMEQDKKVGLDERVYDVPDYLMRLAVPLESNVAYSTSRKS